MKKTARRRKLLRDDRGSALLVSLMVIVGLSLLGLGFVALSETESTIAKNQAATLQTQAIAESGARLVVEWFQSPTWGVNYGGCPSNNPAVNANLSAIKVTRISGSGSSAYSGVYKSDASTMLFDKPYRPNGDDRFYGGEQSPDIRINSTTDLATLVNINNILLGTTDADKASGEITEIDVYAPPIVGGTLVQHGSNYFWEGGQRYGVATIKAVAQQFRDPSLTGTNKYAASNVLSQHTVRLVVGELPLPIPAGPIQGNANVSFGGNFRVHWGMETSQATLTPSLTLSSLPWANAYERPHFEHGYEPGNSIATIIVTNGGSGYTVAPLVTISAPNGPNPAQATATATISGGIVTAITLNVGGRGHGYISTPPTWNPTVTIAAPPPGGTQATAIASIGTEHWPITMAPYEDADYFNELLGKSFDDPWYGARSVGDNLIDGTTAANTNLQCWGYTYSSDETSTAQPSYAFQWQNANQWPNKKLVTFPVINYAYWKRIAQQGRGYKGIYYFNYVGPHQFQKFNNGTPDSMVHWVNTMDYAKLGAGVYFFDTKDTSNPQLPGGGTNTAVLTDAEAWNSNDFGTQMLMQGFIYMNASQFGTTGQGNKATTVQANFPGEPFRDVGTPRWDTAANDWVRSTPGGPIQYFGIGDATFSWDDLNNNGHVDIVVMQAPNWTSYDPNATNGPNGNWVVKTWKSVAQATQDYGAPCTVPPANYNGTNGSASDCSESHEPFLNLIYPSTAANNNGAPTPVTVGWENPTNQTRRAKVLDSAGNPVSCSQTSATTDCTSNSYDKDGGIAPLDVILDGIIYNEGDYDASGNSWYYGSLLIRGTIGAGGGGANGTADVWFDEKLLKGTWAPPNMPRVIVFNEQTDEVQQ